MKKHLKPVIHTRQAVLAISIASLIVTMIPTAFAFQLTATVIANQDLAEAEYISSQLIVIEYPNGGELKSLLAGVKDEVKFTADKNTPGVNEFIKKINDVLVKERQSPAQVEDLKLEYKAALKDEGNQASLQHFLKFDAVLKKIVIQAGTYNEPDVIDLNWRGFSIDEPIVIETQEFGKIDVNLPSGYLYAKQPKVMSLLEGTEASKILSLPLLDYLGISELPMENWHRLFNPIAGQTTGQEFGFQERGGYKSVTVYAAGESSLREGIHEIKQEKVDVTINGVDYVVRSTGPASSATMDILGWSKTSMTGEYEIARVFLEPPTEEGGESPTGSFPIMVLAILGGMLGAVAGFVLWRANKK